MKEWIRNNVLLVYVENLYILIIICEVMIYLIDIFKSVIKKFNKPSKNEINFKNKYKKVERTLKLLYSKIQWKKFSQENDIIERLN